MANEFTIPGTLVGGGKASFGELERIESQILNDLEVTAIGDASIGIFTGATDVGSYNFGTGVTAASANIEYDHNTTQMRFDIDGVPEITIDASGGTTVTTIAGDLTVSGTTTTVNSTDLNITDNVILLNKDEVGAGITLGSAGIEIERGSLTNAKWIYDETNDWWGPSGATQTIGNVAAIDSTDSAEELLTINGVGAIKIPAGTTAQQPVSGINGMVRYNSDLANFEVFVNSAWEELLNTGSSVTISGDFTMDTGAQFFLDDGIAADPGLAFANDTDTGIFLAGGDTIGFSTDGLVQFTISDTTIDGQGNTLTNIADPSNDAGVGDRLFNDGRYVNVVGDSMTGALSITDTGEALTVTRTTVGTVASFALDTNVLTSDICIAFNADDSLNAVRTYGQLCVEIVDNVSTTLDAKMEFKLQLNNVLTPVASIDNTGLYSGTATAALYSDLAERYAADMDLEPGTVVVFGGEAEITKSFLMEDTAVAGVISTTPAFRMNNEAGDNKTHPYVALKGRVPCKVTGPIKRGDLLVTATLHGHAMSVGKRAQPYTAFARALENFSGGTGVIEVAII